MRTNTTQSRRDFRMDDRAVVVHVGPVIPNSHLTVFWLGGTPHSGALLTPHLEAASAQNVQLVAVARPGFGGSTRYAGRNVAMGAADVIRVADMLGIERFALMGYSGGAPHALAVGALAGRRILGIATFGSPAPFSDDGSWFEGMRDPGALLSALDGRATRESWDENAQFDPGQFTDDDYATLEGPLVTLGEHVNHAARMDFGGSVNDDLALVAPWGVDLRSITAHVQIVHGVDDRVVPFAHAQRISRECASSETHAEAGRGHLGVLLGWDRALDRLLSN